jgi:hypothetical protein
LYYLTGGSTPYNVYGSAELNVAGPGSGGGGGSCLNQADDTNRIQASPGGFLGGGGGAPGQDSGNRTSQLSRAGSGGLGGGGGGSAIFHGSGGAGFVIVEW